MSLTSKNLVKKDRIGPKETSLKYQALVQAIPDLIFINDSKFTYLDVIYSRKEDLVIPPEQIIGKTVGDLGFPLQLRKKIEGAISKVIKTKKKEIFEYETKTLAGEIDYFEARVVPFDDSKVISIIRNIGDKVRAEKKQNELLTEFKYLNQHLRAVSEIAVEISRFMDLDSLCEKVVNEIKEKFHLYWCGLFLVDEDEYGDCLALKSGTGQEGEQMLRNGFRLRIDDKAIATWVFRNKAVRVAQKSKNDHEALSSAYLPKTVSEMALPLISGGNIIGVISLQCEKERKFTQELITNFEILAGQISTSIANVILYENLKKELEFKENTRNALIESEERYKSLVEDQPVLLVRYKNDGSIVYANDYYASFHDLSKEELYKKNIYDFVLSSDLKKVRKHLNSISPDNIRVSAENRMKTADGKIKWINWIDKGILDNHGKVIEIQAVGYDITESKSNRENLIRAKEEAIQLSKIKDEFLANMSHEIRSPLNVVVGMSDLLKDTHLDLTQKQYVDSIKDSSVHLLSVVNDLLDFSTMKAGKASIVNAKFNLKDLLENIQYQTSFDCQKKGLNLYLKIDKNVPYRLFGDQNHLRQMIQNLVSNAIKFTPKGSIYIKVSLERNQAKFVSLKFCVKDTGIGIPKDKFNLIFNDFSQVRSDLSRVHGGVGLGLPIVRNLVEMHDGRLWLESEVGKGSEFYFVLPFKYYDDQIEPQQNLNKQPNCKIDYRNISILVVEDNILNQQILGVMLRKRFRKIDKVVNGFEALAKLNQKHYDLILLDIQMPEMDGFELTRRIRSDKAKNFSNISIIATTAHSLSSEKNKALAYGMDGYLCKPFTQEMLFEQINSVLSITHGKN